jgi:antitoxin component YwqK of YwqJK toxin-antitoxin module
VFGVFLKGMRIGEWKFYYPNEVLYCKGKYSDSIFFLWVNDDCEKGTSVFAGAAAKLFLQKKKDIWRYYDKNGKLIRKEIYSNKGNLKRIIFKSDMYIPNLGIYYESTKEIFWDIW